MDGQGLGGRLLVAAPELGDPRFRRRVVLVLAHDDDGAFGVVLDQPAGVGVADVLPGWEGAVSAPREVFQGGPVDPDVAVGVVVLAADADPPPSVRRVTGPFGVVDLEAGPLATGAGVLGARLFAGYAGWSAGQLEAEVATGDWYVLVALPDDAVTPAPDTLWRRVLRRQGGDLAIVSTFAEDPTLN